MALAAAHPQPHPGAAADAPISEDCTHCQRIRTTGCAAGASAWPTADATRCGHFVRWPHVGGCAFCRHSAGTEQLTCRRPGHPVAPIDIARSRQGHCGQWATGWQRQGFDDWCAADIRAQLGLRAEGEAEPA